MGYGSIAGRCNADPDNPISQVVCDRCGIWTPHNRMQFQHDYRGKTLANIRIFVCDVCLDTPQPQLKPRVIPVDPLPTPNARTEPYVYDESNNRYTTTLPVIDFFTGIPIATGENRITQNMENRTTQQTGTAPGSRNMFPGTLGYMVPDDIGLPYDYTGVPNTGIIVEEFAYVYWLSNTTNPTWWRNTSGFGIYWTGKGPA